MIDAPSLNPPSGTKALMFDCDGTLVDTLGLYKICWHQVFGRRGFEMTDEWFTTWMGHSIEPFVRSALPAASSETVAAVVKEGIDLFLESTHLLEPLDHVVTIARAHHGRIPMAVVSGGKRVAVEESLKAVGIASLFDHVVTVDDVVNGKPSPDVYLLAMELMGVTADECAVYEDTASGMDSASAAGISVIFDVRLPLA